MAQCPFCSHQFTVEESAQHQVVGLDPTMIQSEIDSLSGQLRENVTQITELRGIMSRLNMELHRHQIRLDRLVERQNELNTEIEQAKARL